MTCSNLRRCICNNVSWRHRMIKSNTRFSPSDLSLEFIYVSTYPKSQYRLGQSLYNPTIYCHQLMSSWHTNDVDRSLSDTTADYLQTYKNTFLACVWHASFSMQRPSYFASVWHWVFTSNKGNPRDPPRVFALQRDCASSDRHTQGPSHYPKSIVSGFGPDLTKK